ncbi:DUF1496 domain-containing protein [Janthinobacterium sp. SUN176]|uniref:DUF1496 domain-containing protein n=1 Tax=Janthinobacterium sp. SUN176 TaxID=3014788 RepID=UPI0035148128
MGISRFPKRSTLVAKKNHLRKARRKDRLTLKWSAVRWKVAALAPLLFACCWPQYRCVTMTSMVNNPVRNLCYFEGKAYTVGVVIETARGIKCECASANSDGLPTWVSGRWS